MRSANAAATKRSRRTVNGSPVLFHLRAIYGQALIRFRRTPRRQTAAAPRRSRDGRRRTKTAYTRAAETCAPAGRTALCPRPRRKCASRRKSPPERTRKRCGNPTGTSESATPAAGTRNAPDTASTSCRQSAEFRRGAARDKTHTPDGRRRGTAQAAAGRSTGYVRSAPDRPCEAKRRSAQNRTRARSVQIAAARAQSGRA